MLQEPTCLIFPTLSSTYRECVGTAWSLWRISQSSNLCWCSRSLATKWIFFRM